MNLLKKYKVYILIMYAFLIFINFGIKDSFYPLSVLFYASPLILIIVLGFFLTWVYRKNKTAFLGLFTLTCLFSIHWFNNYYNLEHEQQNLADTESILFWNVAKKQQLQTDIIIRKMERTGANIIALLETRHLKNSEVETLKNKFPDYAFQSLKDEMLIGVKGRIDSVFNRYIEDSYKFNYIEATINNKKTKILISDVSASPFINKEKPLMEILNFSETNSIDVIIGDFNTPFESVHFNNYKLNFNSFHNYSNGFTATWPFGIPLLELDQIWLSKKYQPIVLKKEQFSKSDHKLLVAEYVLKK